MTTIRMHHLGCYILALLCLSGCKVPKDRILFVTKTSFGIDVDAKPPTLDVGYSRKEGTISPGFEGGVLPQMASFSTKSQVGKGLFQTAVGQSFATGTAAVILAKHIGTDAVPIRSNTIGACFLDSNKKSSIKGTPDDSQIFFFGTDTNWGLAVSFGVETGGLPDSVHFGYKRKELAYVAITTDDPNNPNGPTVNLPSLLATSGFRSDVSSKDAGLTYVQFFATGKSARYLAADPGVRKAIGSRIIADPNVDAEIAKFAEQQEQQWEVLNSIEALHNVTSAANQTLIIQKAQAIFGKDPAGNEWITDINSVSDMVNPSASEVLPKLKELRGFAQKL